MRTLMLPTPNSAAAADAYQNLVLAAPGPFTTVERDVTCL